MSIPARLLTIALLAACDDPPPPKPEPAATTVPPEMPSLEPLAPALPAARRGEPLLAPATMKRYRLELCWLGGHAVAYAREAYWESLDDHAPDADHLPSFGDYVELEPRAPGGRAPLAAKMGRLPFERHLRACAAAKVPAMPEIDEALAAFEPKASAAASLLLEAARYYARAEYQRDAFERGRKHHDAISDELGGAFDGAHAAYGKALAAWLEKLGPAPEDATRDEAGKLASQIIVEARALTALWLDDKRDPARVEALTRLERALGKDTAHGQALAQPLAAFLAVVAAEERGARGRYLVSARFADLLEADSRGLMRLAGGR